MTSLLKVWLVKYQCSCSAWYPLCQLHFCRKCAKLKCPICVVEEMDTIFCPYCLENISQTEALQRRFRCQVCNECPMCGKLFLTYLFNFYVVFLKVTCWACVPSPIYITCNAMPANGPPETWEYPTGGLQMSHGLSR